MVKIVRFQCPECKKESEVAVTFLKFISNGQLEVTCSECGKQFVIKFEITRKEQNNG